MGTREEQKQKRRADILACCLNMFITYGYDGTTIRDIAAELDMSIGLFFHYFKSKEEIYIELITIAQSGVNQMKILLDMPIEPITIFETIADSIFRSFKDYPMTAPFFLLVNQAMTLRSTPQSVKEIVMPMSAIEQTVPIILKGQEKGQIKEGNSMALASAFWGAIQGIAESIVWYPEIPMPKSSWIVDIIRHSRT